MEQQERTVIMFHYLSQDKVYMVLPQAWVRMSEMDEHHYRSVWSALLTRKPYPFLLIGWELSSRPPMGKLTLFTKTPWPCFLLLGCVLQFTFYCLRWDRARAVKVWLIHLWTHCHSLPVLIKMLIQRLTSGCPVDTHRPPMYPGHPWYRGRGSKSYHWLSCSCHQHWPFPSHLWWHWEKWGSVCGHIARVVWGLPHRARSSLQGSSCVSPFSYHRTFSS